MMNYITLADPKHDDSWICLCGNTPCAEGFYPCNEHGEQVEPTPEAWATDCYVCDRCGRIIRQNDRQVLGQRSTP
jgi:hypothetical protein